MRWTDLATTLPSLILAAATLLYAIILTKGKASLSELMRVKADLEAAITEQLQYKAELREYRAECDRMQREVLRLVKIFVEGQIDG
jgi:hypothetical protein